MMVPRTGEPPSPLLISDTHAAGCGGVEGVGEISGNRVGDDLVPVHVIRRSAESRAHMRVEGDAPKSVAGQLVPDDHVIGDAARAVAIRKKAYSRASDLHAVARRDVLGYRLG